MRFCVEKNSTKNCACDAKRTNIRYDLLPVKDHFPFVPPPPLKLCHRHLSLLHFDTLLPLLNQSPL